MCLQVAFVVNDKRNCRVTKAWKRLEWSWPNYVTPHQYKTVPCYGLLMPLSVCKKADFVYGDMIRGGFIHSYYKPKPDAVWWERPTSNCTEFKAFAIGVVAWGDSNSDHQDQVSRALYIPQCDGDKKRRARRVKLLSSKKIPTVKQLVKEFPELKKIAHLL